MNLQSILDDPQTRRRFVSDGVQVVHAEVGRKSGLSGMAIKTGFKAIQTVRPGIVGDALDMLLPHFAPAVQPHVDAGLAAGDLAAHFRAHADAIAEDLLAVTDARADRAQNAVLKKTYQRLRGQAHHHTSQAMPAVGALLARYA